LQVLCGILLQIGRKVHVILAHDVTKHAGSKAVLGIAVVINVVGSDRFGKDTARQGAAKFGGLTQDTIHWIARNVQQWMLNNVPIRRSVASS
jgi:hypothetical protein